MNLDTTIDIDLKGFFQWWGKELAFLAPKALRRQLRDRHGNVIFTPNGQGFDVVFYDDDGNTVTQRRIEPADIGHYQQLKNQYPAIEKAELVLRLPADHGLHKSVFLPAAAQENLQQVLGFELDRYTPFKMDHVYFSAILIGNTGYGQLQVLLIIAPKIRLDEPLALLETWGVRPRRVDYLPTTTDFPQYHNAYNLLPERYRQTGGTLRQSAHWLMSVLLLSLLFGVLVLPVWMEGQAVESLKTRIRQLEKQNQVVDAQQTEIDALRTETQRLIDTKRQAPALLPVLNELSNLLNDDTWLTHMQFSGQHMQIQGQSPAASALIAALETSEFFSNVSFVSPLTQDKVTGRERFQIGMDITMPASTDAVDGESASDRPANAASNEEDMPAGEAALEEEAAGE